MIQASIPKPGGPARPAHDEAMSRGRPPKPPEERATARIQLACTQQEKKRLEKAAAKGDKPLSRWIIEQALRATDPPPKRR